MSAKQIIIRKTKWTFGTKALDTCLDSWADKPVLDAVIMATVLCAHWWAVRETRRGDLLAWTGTTGQTAIFATGATVMSLVAGFAGVGLLLYSSAAGNAADLIRKTHGKKIRANWLDIISWLMLSATLCIVALAMDTQSTGPAQWVFEAAFMISILKFARMVIVLRLILVAMDKAAESSETSKIELIDTPP